MPRGVLDEDEDEEAWDDDWEEEESPSLPWPELPVLAVDCPSGMDCDSGAVAPETFRADLTTACAGFPDPARALGQLDGGKTLPLLVNALADQDKDVRSNVVEALVKVGLLQIQRIHLVPFA